MLFADSAPSLILVFFSSSHISIPLFLHHPKVLNFFLFGQFFFNDNWFIWKLLLLLCMCVCVNSLIYDMQILSALPLIFSFYLNWIFFSLYNDRLIDKEILLSFALEKKTQQNKKETAIFFHTLIVYRYTYITKAIYLLSFHFEIERRH